jgi:hypothetical protein
VTALAAVLAISGLAACDPPPPPVVLRVTLTGSVNPPDTNPGDGICRAVGYVQCSLRAALEEASASHVDRIDVGDGSGHRVATPLVVDPVAPVLTIQVGADLGDRPAILDVASSSGPILDVRSGTVVVAGGLTMATGGPTGIRVATGATAVLDEVGVSGSSSVGVEVDGRLVARRTSIGDGAGTGLAVGPAASVDLVQSSVHGHGGPGIGVAAGGSVRATSSTVSGNDVGIETDGDVDLTLSTVADNQDWATWGSGTVTARGSILVERDGSSGCAAPLASEGWNGLGDGCTRTATDVEVGPTALSALASGPVPYHRLGAGGTALRGLVDVGDGPCTAGVVDQRGIDRTTDGACDAGAYDGPIQVESTTWTVDVATDGDDVEPGDGLCSTADGGCSLRAALDEAAAADPAGPVPTVHIADGVNPVLEAGSPALAADRVHIIGGGATVDAGGGATALAHCTGDLLVEDVVLTGGGPSTHGRGLVDAVGCEASWDPTGRIELARVVISGNASHAVSGEFLSDVDLRLVDSAITDNGGAAVGDDFTSVELVRSTIAGNGGGITLAENSGQIVVTESTISNNGQVGLSAPYASYTVTRSLITGHSFAGVIAYGGTATIVDSTVSGNGIGVDASDAGGATIRRSTLTGNGSAYRGDEVSALRIGGSVVQGPGQGCAVDDGQVTSEGWNVAADATCGLTGTGDQQGVEALLGPLADNGGPTLTHLPGGGSPAIDAIPSGTAGLCAGTLLDQRGVTRPQGPACDRGAVEQ